MMTSPSSAKEKDGIIIKETDKNVSITDRKEFISLLTNIANRISKEQKLDEPQSP